MPATFAVVLCVGLAAGGVTARVAQRNPVPKFEFDSAWPKMPSGRILGNIEGLSVDARDHIWVAHRPGTVGSLYWAALQRSECCLPLPPVSEFDQAGNFVQGFGPVTSRQPKAPGVTSVDDMPKAFDWPAGEHGMFVDHKDAVWLAGTGTTDGHVLKFTRQGMLLLQIGKPGQSQGNSDTRNLYKPTRVWVSPKTNEAFVADGYVNRRVIVFDADTGAFKRMWGAYGNAPVDPSPEDRPKFLFNDTEPGHRPREDKGEGRGPDYFNIAHSIAVSRDDLVYVADATNGAVRILHRQSLDLLGSFGQLGHQAGQLDHVHNVAVDSRGNVYAGDVTGARIQRWLYKGTS